MLQLVLVLLSCSCRNKLPQTVSLKTTEMCSLTFLGARNPKLWCQQGCTSSRVSLPCLFQLLVALGFLWFSAAHLCLPSRALLLCICQFSSAALIRTLVVDLGHTWVIQDDLISRFLTELHLQRPFSKIRSHSQVCGAKTWTYLLGSQQSTH